MEKVVNKELPKTFWIVEFNESDIEIGVKDYKCEMVTEEILEEIKKIDEKIVGKCLGYYKFYFEKIVDGEVETQIRVDIGDGNEANKEAFDFLFTEIKNNNEMNLDENGLDV
ncbi:MAG: hypothetical protein WBO70_00815 [Erysipelotrichaceae bacterium]